MRVDPLWDIVATETARHGRRGVLYKCSSESQPLLQSSTQTLLPPKFTIRIPKSFYERDTSVFLVAIGLIYFYIGIMQFPRLALTFFEKDSLHLSAAAAQAVDSSQTFPWMIKPVYGLISDFLPIFGMHRKPYLVISSTVVIFSYFYLATMTVVESVVTPAFISVFMGTLVFNAMGVTFSDVIADSLVVRKIGDGVPYASSLQSFVWMCRSTGNMIAAWFGGYALTLVPPQKVFLIAASFPLLVIISAIFFIKEQSNEDGMSDEAEEVDFDNRGMRGLLLQLRNALSEPIIWKTTLFIFCIMATPGCDTAMMYFFTNNLGFQDDKEFFGRRDLITSLAALVGIVAFQKFLRHIRLRPIILWSTCIGTVLQATTLVVVTRINLRLNISDKVFVLGNSGIVAVLGQVQFMPILALAARICPRGIEGTMFAFLMSVSNTAMLTGQYSGAFLTHMLGIDQTHFDNLWLLVLICTLLTPAPLVLLRWVPNYDPRTWDKPAPSTSKLSQPPSLSPPTATPAHPHPTHPASPPLLASSSSHGALCASADPDPHTSHVLKRSRPVPVNVPHGVAVPANLHDSRQGSLALGSVPHVSPASSAPYASSISDLSFAAHPSDLSLSISLHTLPEHQPSRPTHSPSI